MIFILSLKEQNHYIYEIPKTATLDSYPIILIPGFLLGALTGMYAAKMENKELDNQLDTVAIGKTNHVFWKFVVDILVFYTGSSFFAVTLGTKNYNNPLLRMWKFIIWRNVVWLLIALGLRLDGGTSISSKILRVRILGAIGKNTFHLYMMQFPTLIIIKYVFHHNKNFLSRTARQIVLTLAPIIVSDIVRKKFDEPIQELLG